MVLVAIGLGLLGYLYFRQGMWSHGQPGWEPDGTVIGEIDYTDLQNGGQGDHFVTPEQHIGPVVYLPCRYPRHSGENLTCLIHQGFSSLTAPHFLDQSWAWQPPSEADL
jgi:hypothetical protein